MSPYRTGPSTGGRLPTWTVTLKSGQQETVHAESARIEDAGEATFFVRRVSPQSLGGSDRQLVAAYAKGEWQSFKLDHV